MSDLIGAVVAGLVIAPLIIMLWAAAIYIIWDLFRD